MNIGGISTGFLWEYISGATQSTGEVASSSLELGGAGAEVFAAASATAEDSQVQGSSSGSSSSGAFDPLDTNQDGHVSFEELESAMQLQRASQVTQTRLVSGGARPEVRNGVEEQARGKEIYREAGLAAPAGIVAAAGPGAERGVELSV